jgi:hypothetical protein
MYTSPNVANDVQMARSDESTDVMSQLETQNGKFKDHHD